MTEIEEKALALVNKVRAENRGFTSAARPHLRHADMEELEAALCRAIEQHEAYKQDVSDMLVRRGYSPDDCGFGRFIIPKPPVDPLVEALAQLDWSDKYAERLREALAKRGLKIVETEQ